MARRKRPVFGIKRERIPSPPFNRSGGKVTNKYDVTVTEAELREFRLRVRAVNSFLKRRNDTIRREQKKYLPKGTVMVGEPYGLYTQKSASLSQFKSRKAFLAMNRRLSYLYDRTTRTSELLNIRAAVNKQNWLKALDTTLGGQFADHPYYKKILEMVSGIDAEEFLLAIASQAISGITDIYYGYFEDKLAEIYAEVYDYVNRDLLR